jgi:type II restriction enzyme
MRVTAQNLVRAINQLPRDQEYQYVNPSNRGRIVIHNVHEPEGPIEIKRYNPNEGETADDKPVESLSTQMIWRMANAILPEKPINVDRVFGGSYNTRSVFEALLAHTPLFYWCKPGRIELMNAYKRVKPGHKHLIYLPNQPHQNGVLGYQDINMEISEVTVDVVYKGVTLDAVDPPQGMTIEQKRRHAQIQIALVLIGQQLGFRTWVASNDRSIEYEGRRIAELDAVVDSLNAEQVLSAYPDAANAARLIDCIWFRNGRLMPAVMEIEHSTGVTSGLTRMKDFYDLGPPLRDIRWTVVAPDEDRQKVIDQANREQFRELDTRFFPYSAVEELYSLCDRRQPQGITDQFLDCFMEKCVAA